MTDDRPPIASNPPRWKPNPDPSTIQVPGLDTNASVHEQIEQIEQLITIKLQNIDETFSKIHHVLSSKLLPAVKRYAVGTEPVREAAKFWTSFYEQAAQIRIPSYDDFSTVNDLSSERDEVDTTASEGQSHISRDGVDSSQRDYEPSIENTESSFMPGQAAFSSTPATARGSRTMESFVSQGSDPSWTPSIESPLLRLSREVQNLSTEDNEINLPSTSARALSVRIDEPTPHAQRQETSILPRSDKGKGKESKQPLLKNLLKHNLYSASESSFTEFSSKTLSPLKPKGKTPVIKNYNPYLPPDTDSGKWSGLVDLRDPSTLTPQRHRSAKHLSGRRGAAPVEDTDDDSFDGLPPGMSPPVLMSPARPPRSSAELGLLGQTPSKEATTRITRDLVRNAQLQSTAETRRMYGYSTSGVDTSMSTVPTPPSLSRYRQHDSDISDSIAEHPSFDSMIRRVGLNMPSTSRLASTPGLRLRPRSNNPTQAAPLVDQYLPDDLNAVTQESGHAGPDYVEAHSDSFSDSDSLEEINNTAHPSAAFLMASQGTGSDDSFGSSNHSGDSLTEEDANLGIVPIHPFAGGVEDNGFDDDDSFEYDDGAMGEVQEETVFGVAPAQRIHAHAVQSQHPTDGLRMLGEDLLQDTIGMGAHLALTGRVEESPTPASWNNLRG